jgi:hypothetical protein
MALEIRPENQDRRTENGRIPRSGRESVGRRSAPGQWQSQLRRCSLKPALRTKSVGTKVSEAEFALLEASEWKPGQYHDESTESLRSFRTIPAAKKQSGSHTFITASMANLPREPMAIGISSTYEVIFDGAKSSGRREFHEVGIKVDRPNLGDSLW